jgi:lysozyme
MKLPIFILIFFSVTHWGLEQVESATRPYPMSDAEYEALMSQKGKGHHSPYALPVHGIDVSRYQGDIDWPTVRNAGVSFVFIKATEGGDHKDPFFEKNWHAAKAAGIPRGAYHFVYWCRPAAEQVKWYINNVPKDSTALPPVLDVEWNGHSKTCPIKVPAEEARAGMELILKTLETHYRKKPIIYTDYTFYKDVLSNGAFKNYPLWVRSIHKVKGHPVHRWGDRPWHFWQYTEKKSIPGIRAYVDANAFFGSRHSWKSWLRRNGVPH